MVIPNNMCHEGNQKPLLDGIQSNKINMEQVLADKKTLDRNEDVHEVSDIQKVSAENPNKSLAKNLNSSKQRAMRFLSQSNGEFLVETSPDIGSKELEELSEKPRIAQTIDSRLSPMDNLSEENLDLDFELKRLSNETPIPEFEQIGGKNMEKDPLTKLDAQKVT